MSQEIVYTEQPNTTSEVTPLEMLESPLLALLLAAIAVPGIVVWAVAHAQHKKRERAFMKYQKARQKGLIDEAGNALYGNNPFEHPDTEIDEGGFGLDVGCDESDLGDVCVDDVFSNCLDGNQKQIRENSNRLGVVSSNKSGEFVEVFPKSRLTANSPTDSDAIALTQHAGFTSQATSITTGGSHGGTPESQVRQDTPPFSEPAIYHQSPPTLSQSFPPVAEPEGTSNTNVISIQKQLLMKEVEAVQPIEKQPNSVKEAIVKKAVIAGLSQNQTVKLFGVSKKTKTYDYLIAVYQFYKKSMEVGA